MKGYIDIVGSIILMKGGKPEYHQYRSKKQRTEILARLLEENDGWLCYIIRPWGLDKTIRHKEQRRKSA